MRKIIFIPIIIVTLLLAASSCRQGRHHNSSSENDSLMYLYTDSLIRATCRNCNLEQSLHVIDSLLELDQISEMRADFGRAGAYMLNYQPDMCYRLLRKVINDYNAKGGDIRLYSMAVVNLSSYLGEGRSQYEAALQLALPAIKKIENSPLVDPVDIGCILVTIGWCQRGLEHFDEARKSYEKAYHIFKEYEGNKNFDVWDYYECIKAMTTVFDSYSKYGMPDEKMRFTDYCDSMLTFYSRQPGHESDCVDWIKGRVYLSRAEVLAEKHQFEAAAKAYDQFLQTESSKLSGVQLKACTYLEYAGRYAEAADIMKEYDNIALEENFNQADLEEINNHLFPKFRNNYRAGRIDSALAIAVRIDSLMIPATRAQKRSDAAELATIYETQQKEAEIARQQALLSKQRMWAAVIVFVLVTIFFVIYTLVRRRAAKRLAEMKAAQERIESELRIARDIQMSMVPSTFPDYEGLDMYASMTPAKEVGGDLYGYVIIGDKLYFALGDVSGKGVPASLFMAQATRLFRTLATQQMMPAEICTRMNDALSGDDNESGMFVTFWLGLIDLKTGHLDFCNAGHNPPVIGGGEHRGEFLDMQPNAPIGLWPGLEYEGEEIETVKGRSLFIYTDGLNEAENRQQEQFGEDRLLDILRTTHFDSAQQVIDKLKDEVERHRDGAEPNDDLTMMCVRLV